MKTTLFYSSRSRRGSFIGLTMILAMALAVTAAAYISMTTTAVKTTQANQTQHNLLHPGERGIDEAMHTLYRYAKVNKIGEEWMDVNFDMWKNGGWTRNESGNYYTKNFWNVPVDSAGGYRYARLKVLVRDVPCKNSPKLIPNIISEVTYLGSDSREWGADRSGGRSYARQFSVWLRPRSNFANSMVGINSVTVSGGVFSADSYNAKTGAYTGVFSSGNPGDKATIATLATRDDAISTGSISVRGYVVTGGDNPIDGIAGSHVYGYSTDPAYAYARAGIDPTRIAQDFNATMDLVPAPSTATATPFPAGVVVGAGAARRTVYTLEAGTYKLSSILRLSGGEQVLVKGDVTLIAEPGADISLSGSAELRLNDTSSKLTLYSPANIDVTGNGVINPALSTGTRLVTVYGTNKTPGGQLLKFAGNAAFSGVVYAPNANVEIKGGGSDGAFYGSVVGYNIKATGGTNFHYDESLTAVSEPSFNMFAWLELKGDSRVKMAAYGL